MTSDDRRTVLLNVTVLFGVEGDGFAVEAIDKDVLIAGSGFDKRALPPRVLGDFKDTEKPPGVSWRKK